MILHSSFHIIKTKKGFIIISQRKRRNLSSVGIELKFRQIEIRGIRNNVKKISIIFHHGVKSYSKQWILERAEDKKKIPRINCKKIKIIWHFSFVYSSQSNE